MKYSLLFALLLLNSFCLLAQPSKPIRVKAGDDIAQAYSPNGFYRFPQFSKATLFYKNGAQNSGSVFNYNILSGNMQFISKDTLDLSGLASLDSIVFDGTTFVYDNSAFLETMAAADSVRLLKKTQVKTQVENVGGYGLPNATASIINMRSYASGNGVFNLVINQDVLVIERKEWFFATGNNIVKASKSNLLKLLSPEKQKIAGAYLKENKTNFEKEADLQKLMATIAK